MSRFTMADLEPHTYEFHIDDPNGNDVSVLIKSISEEDFQGIMDYVPMPPVQEIIAKQPDGRIKKETNPDDPEYRRKLRDGQREQTRRLVSACLVMEPPLPGDTFAEKAKTVAKFPSWFMLGVVSLIYRVMGIPEGEVSQRAETFRPV